MNLFPHLSDSGLQGLLLRFNHAILIRGGLLN